MTEEIDVPSWIKGRQAKVEPVGPGTYRVTGPNLPDAVVGVRMDDDLRWKAYLKAVVDGPEIAIADLSQSTLGTHSLRHSSCIGSG